jgi:hypothetical protein
MAEKIRKGKQVIKLLEIIDYEAETRNSQNQPKL